jgi:hypothetical protein
MYIVKLYFYFIKRRHNCLPKGVVRVAKGPSWPFLEKKYKMDDVVNLIQPKSTVKSNSASRLLPLFSIYMFRL